MPKHVIPACEEVPNSRQEAIRVGSKYYFEKECKNGHKSPRLTSKSECVECKRARDLQYSRDHAAVGIARATKWNAKNKERRAEICRRSYDVNIEKIKESRPKRFRSWYYTNHETVKASKRVRQNRRRALLASAKGDFTCEDVSNIRSMQNDKCALCRVVLNGGGQIDHITPISKGGNNYSRNIQLLCNFCNASKHNHDQIDYMRKKGMLL